MMKGDGDKGIIEEMNEAPEARCPFTSGALKNTAGNGTVSRDWWPNQLKLNI
jgi:catalase-peroxidase